MVIETDLVSETLCCFGILLIILVVPSSEHLRIELLIYLYDEIFCGSTHISHMEDQCTVEQLTWQDI
jgi:hypothetical protein